MPAAAVRPEVKKLAAIRIVADCEVSASGTKLLINDFLY